MKVQGSEISFLEANISLPPCIFRPQQVLQTSVAEHTVQAAAPPRMWREDAHTTLPPLCPPACPPGSSRAERRPEPRKEK